MIPTWGRREGSKNGRRSKCVVCWKKAVSGAVCGHGEENDGPKTNESCILWTPGTEWREVDDQMGWEDLGHRRGPMRPV